MSLREILLWPDERLKQPCETVADVAEVEQLVTDLFETMYDAPGRGLAAPQVGVLKRVFVMDAGWKEGDMVPLACINPEIVEKDGVEVTEEGCLSVPGYFEEVTRAEHVKVRYLDRDGNQQEEDFDGLLAVCVQHEIDHLDGRLFVDYLSEAKRQRIRKRLEKDRRHRQQEAAVVL